MTYDPNALLTNGVFLHGIKLLAGSLWCIFVVGLFLHR